MSKLSESFNYVIEANSFALIIGVLLIIAGGKALIQKKLTWLGGRESPATPKFAAARSRSFEGDDAIFTGVICIVAGVVIVAVALMPVFRANH